MNMLYVYKPTKTLSYYFFRW